MHLELSHHTIVLCNNEIAFPAIRELTFYKSLKAVVVPERNKQVLTMLQEFLKHSGIDVVAVNRKNFEQVVAKLIIEKNAGSVWMMTFPYIITASLLSKLPGKFLNYHYGLLPKYRGPNPILAQMMHYEAFSGITIHVVDEGIDTGPLVLQHKIPIEERDTFGIQLMKLSMLGAELALNLLKIMDYSTVLPSVPQDISQAGYFNNVTAKDLMIKWDAMTGVQVVRLINACNPWNKGAGATLKNLVICFVEAEVISGTLEEDKAAGTIIALSNSEGLRIACLDKTTIRINIIYTPEGFFSGHKLALYGIKNHDRFN